MAHQCLKCGHSYPDGSPEILKGCGGCKGTRFFYTDKPLDAVELEAMSEKAEKDLARLAEVKGERARRERRIPTKAELPVGSGDAPREGKDWMEITPNHLRRMVEDVVKRSSDPKPVFRVGAAPTTKRVPTVAEYAGAPGSDGSDSDGPGSVDPDSDAELLDDLMSPEREAAWREDAKDATGESAAPAASSTATAATDTAAGVSRAAEQGTPEAADADVLPDEDDLVYSRPARGVPEPVSLAGVTMSADEDARLREEAGRLRAAAERDAEAARLAARTAPDPELATEDSLYPEGERPETVGVDDGVYELDIKRLLERNPIVVHKDGSYALHLPSLMETLDARKKVKH